VALCEGNVVRREPDRAPGRLTSVRIVAFALTLAPVAACGGGDVVASSGEPRPSTGSEPYFTR